MSELLNRGSLKAANKALSADVKLLTADKERLLRECDKLRKSVRTLTYDLGRAESDCTRVNEENWKLAEERDAIFGNLLTVAKQHTATAEMLAQAQLDLATARLELAEACEQAEALMQATLAKCGGAQ